jgi:predicted MPP superfamily phosphohydrolase
VQPVEQFRLGLFIAVIVLVYYLAASILVRLALRRFDQAHLPAGRRAVWIRRVILGLASFGTLCIAYGFVEPYWPQVTHVRIASPKLSRGSRPIRIVHISDLHSEAKPRLEGRLPALIAAQRPDLIVFTGDALNSPEGLPVFQRCLARIAAVAPTFAVQGNWDVWYWPHLDLFGGTGVRVLAGEAERMEVAETPIWVAGVPYDAEQHIGRAMAPIPEAAFSVFLYHTPDEIAAVAGRHADLYCAGHIHGGQIALPLYGALVTLSRYGKRFEAGLYRLGQTHLYVNRGIGMEGGWMPRVRFWARPEVTVIEVHPAARDESVDIERRAPRAPPPAAEDGAGGGPRSAETEESRCSRASNRG